MDREQPPFERPIELICRKRERAKKKTDIRRCLDGAFGDHVLAQMVLVLPDATVPTPNGLVLAHHNVLGDLVKQPSRKERAVSNFNK